MNTENKIRKFLSPQQKEVAAPYVKGDKATDKSLRRQTALGAGALGVAAALAIAFPSGGEKSKEPNVFSDEPPTEQLQPAGFTGSEEQAVTVQQQQILGPIEIAEPADGSLGDTQMAPPTVVANEADTNAQATDAQAEPEPIEPVLQARPAIGSGGGATNNLNGGAPAPSNEQFQP